MACPSTRQYTLTHREHTRMRFAFKSTANNTDPKICDAYSCTRGQAQTIKRDRDDSQIATVCLKPIISRILDLYRFTLRRPLPVYTSYSIYICPNACLHDFRFTCLYTLENQHILGFLHILLASSISSNLNIKVSFSFCNLRSSSCKNKNSTQFERYNTGQIRNSNE